MRVKAFAWGLALALCALPLVAQNIPAGDDVWDSIGGGATNTVLLSSDWATLCGVSVGDTAVQFKGYNLPGYGTGDTVVSRLGTADFSQGSTVRVPIKLKALSFVSDGPHPCSPMTIRVREFGTQTQDWMTITRNDSAGGTFSATVPVSVIISADGGGSFTTNGVFNDSSSSPWSYQPPIGGTSGKAWYPSVDPNTHQPVRTCRFGNETAPSQHCYQPPPKCPAKQPLGSAAAKAVAIEPCTIQAEPVAKAHQR